MMLKFVKIIVIILSTLLVSACGFRPVHAPNISNTKIYGNVQINSPKNRSEFIFYQELRARIRDNEFGEYVLEYTMHLNTEPSAIDNSDEAHRIILNGSVEYKLNNSRNGLELGEGTLNASTSYSSASSSVADDAALRGATENLISYLADGLVEELNLSTVHALFKLNE